MKNYFDYREFFIALENAMEQRDRRKYDKAEKILQPFINYTDKNKCSQHLEINAFAFYDPVMWGIETIFKLYDTTMAFRDKKPIVLFCDNKKIFIKITTTVEYKWPYFNFQTNGIYDKISILEFEYAALYKLLIYHKVKLVLS